MFKRPILEDPADWGYHPLGDRKSFVPDHRAPFPPFELDLIGSGQLEIPEELAYMVTIHHDLEYKDFYKLVADCDIVVPAFSSFICMWFSVLGSLRAHIVGPPDYREMASSTVALAVELDVSDFVS